MKALATTLMCIVVGGCSAAQVTAAGTAVPTRRAKPVGGAGTGMHPGAARPGAPRFVPVTDRFDGKPIGQKLAAALAGDETVEEWGNCSFYLTSRGQGIMPTDHTSQDWGTKIPCVYVGTTSGSTARDYYFTDKKCDPGDGCKSGYTLLLEADSSFAVSGSTDKAEYTFSRTFYGRVLRSSPLVPHRTGQGATAVHVAIPARTKFKRQFQIEGRTVLEPTPYRLSQVYDGAGNAIGDPIVEYIPIADTGQGENACQAMFDYYMAHLANPLSYPTTVVIGLETGAGIVVLAYFTMGAEGGAVDISKAISAGSAVGLWANAKGLLTDLRGTVHSSFLAEAQFMKDHACVSNPGPHPPIHQPKPKTPSAPQMNPTSCIDCESAHIESPGSWDPNASLPTQTVHPSYMVCDHPYLVHNGTDTNGDSACDGGIFEEVLQYNATHDPHR